MNLLYSTFLGGSDTECPYQCAIAVDASGAVYIAGTTFSPDFPTTPGAFQTAYGGGRWDAFVAKLSADGSHLVYSTFLGGSGDDMAYDIVVDANGVAYITGSTRSTDFPITPGALQTTCRGCSYYSDAFVAKLNVDGSALLYSTFLGGEGDDAGNGIALDTSGAVYLGGYTNSEATFPTTSGAFQTTYGGGVADGFITKLNIATSELSYSSYIGGDEYDTGVGIALDADGEVYAIGNTYSSNFPTTPGVFQTTCGCDPPNHIGDAFVAKLDAAGSALIYSTYLGGSSNEVSRDVAVDGNGAAYIAGSTDSPDFPTTSGAVDPTFNGGYDVFAAKLDTAGSELEYATFLGGSSYDYGEGIVLNGSGEAYLAGQTFSTDFPITPGAFQPTLGGGDCYGTPCPDAFLTRLNADGSTLVYSTFLGGSDYDQGWDIALDASGVAYTTGQADSPDFPTTPGAFQTTCSNNCSYADAFVTKLMPTLTPYRLYLPFVGTSP